MLRQLSRTKLSNDAFVALLRDGGAPALRLLSVAECFQLTSVELPDAMLADEAAGLSRSSTGMVVYSTVLSW